MWNLVRSYTDRSIRKHTNEPTSVKNHPFAYLKSWETAFSECGQQPPLTSLYIRFLFAYTVTHPRSPGTHYGFRPYSRCTGRAGGAVAIAEKAVGAASGWPDGVLWAAGDAAAVPLFFAAPLGRREAGAVPGRREPV